jgi:fructokinase
MVSRVGDDDLGRRAVEFLAEAGVDTSAIQLDDTRPTGTVDITLESGEPRYQLIGGCAWERIELGDTARVAVERAAALCYGTLSQRDPIGAASLAVALDAAPTSCSAVCDPNLRPGHIDRDILATSLGAADIIKINEAEAERIARALGVTDASASLLASGARLVAITRGPRGCCLVSATETAEHAGFAAELGGDNVGAGDAFTAVLTYMLVCGAGLAEIATKANRYAAFVASRRGATPVIPASLLAELGFRQS